MGSGDARMADGWHVSLLLWNTLLQIQEQKGRMILYEHRVIRKQVKTYHSAKIECQREVALIPNGRRVTSDGFQVALE